MSTKSLFLTWGFIFSLALQYSVFAQEDRESLLIDARLITTSNDTILGKILYENQYSFQFNVSLTDTSGNLLELYTPKELRSFSYAFEKDSVRFISMNNPNEIGKVFLRLLYTGKYEVYQFLELSHRSTSLGYSTSYYLWNREWMKPPITAEHEKESLLFHFSDCPELEYKIKIGEYGFSRISSILSEYENCNLTDDYEFFYE